MTEGPRGTPLDLRAVEAPVNQFSTQHPHEPGIPAALDAEGRCLVCALLVKQSQLLAHCRALRAALRPFLTAGAQIYIDSSLADYEVPPFCPYSVGDFRRAAAVLQEATDA